VVLPIDTAGVPDGTHTLKVTVIDAAQNSSVVYDATITTRNAPVSASPPSIGEAAVQTGETLTGQPGTWLAPARSGSIVYGYRWQSCDPSGAGCRAIPGAQSTSYTASAPDLGHSLRLLVTASNADGASTLASEPSAVVTATAGVSTGPLLAQGTLGAPNGLRASQHARLQIHDPANVRRRYQQRAFTIHGVLTNEQGEAIEGASLEVIGRRAPLEHEVLLARIATAGDGTFTAKLPAGPSRRIVIGYRAFTGATQYSAKTTLTETIAAGVRLRVSPRRTAPGATITLSGWVAGPLPAHGVLVELLVHYRGAWEPFRDARTGAGGRFAVRYHFEGATGRFPFRAKVLGEQSGFPYATGLSRVVDVQSG
jgi:hypothetical protein